MEKRGLDVPKTKNFVLVIQQKLLNMEKVVLWFEDVSPGMAWDHFTGLKKTWTKTYTVTY